MEFYAYHGHLKEEKVVGGKFIVDVSVETNTDKAMQTDNLHDALDYQKIYDDIRQEMSQKSNLLENIAYRISERLFNNYPEITQISLTVSKLNPPLRGKTEKVTVQVEKKRE